MDDTDLALLLDRFMRHLHFGLQAKAADFDTAKVGPGGGIILLTLNDMGQTSLHALTQQVARDKSQMTRAIRALEDKGLVTRTASPRDARVTLVALTAAGAEVVRGLQEAVAGTISGLLAPLPEGDRTALRRLLAAALEDAPAPQTKGSSPP